MRKVQKTRKLCFFIKSVLRYVIAPHKILNHICNNYNISYECIKTGQDWREQDRTVHDRAGHDTTPKKRINENRYQKPPLSPIVTMSPLLESCNAITSDRIPCSLNMPRSKKPSKIDFVRNSLSLARNRVLPLTLG